MKNVTRLMLVVVFLVAGILNLRAQGTAFTYQGMLNTGGSPATGSYDLTFQLFNAATNGSQVGATRTNSATAVSNGLFAVNLDFGAVFTGSNYWVGIAARTNGGSAFTNLFPLLPITPAPYAITAENATTASVLSGQVSSGNLNGTFTNAVTFNNASNVFAGNGGALTNLANVWSLNGNLNTTPGAEFLGTTDSNAVELHVNGGRALRLEPTAGGPNVIGGSPLNSAVSNITSATIAGGLSNTVGAIGAFVGGGGEDGFTVAGNQAGAGGSVVGGGVDNIIYPGANDAVIGGGAVNTVTNDAAQTVIVGGWGNLVAAPGAFIGGGGTDGGSYTGNQTGGAASVIVGGIGNIVGAGATESVLVGGYQNIIGANGLQDTIVGGYQNIIGANGLQDTIGGGYQNYIDTNIDDSTVGGGAFNTVSNGASSGTISGGFANAVLASYATIGGGDGNTNSGFGAVIGGGGFNGIAYLGNHASGVVAVIGGGIDNQATRTGATVPGGSNNIAGGKYSFAAGQEAHATNDGAFVWADSQAGSFSSTNNDSFNVRAQGGVVFTDGTTHSVSWTPGGGSWTFASDRNLKDHFAPVDATSVLDKVSKLPVTEWSYKGYGQRHIGAMAQDFHALFPLNNNDKVLNDADLHGVELAAIKGLNQKVEAQASELKAKDAAIQALEERLERLESRLER